MIVILNSKTHVGANPPSDTTKTWISADMTEISIYPEPETYGRLNARIDVKAILLAHNLDIKSDRVRVFSLADNVLEVKRYINGEWIVIDNPDDYVDIIMNGKVIGTMEVDTIAPDEQVDEWDGSGVVIEALASTGLITFTVYGKEYQAEDGMTWAEFIDSEYNPDTNYDTSTTSIEKRFELFNSAVYYASDEYNRRPLITEEGSTGNVYSTDVVQPIEYDYYVAPGGSN